MSSSTKLRQTQTEYGGGRNIYNLAAKDQEVNLSACVDLVVEYFQKKHPELEFTRTDRLYKKDIAVELNNGYTTLKLINYFITNFSKNYPNGEEYLLFSNKIYTYRIEI